jgi:choline-sulfatase
VPLVIAPAGPARPGTVEHRVGLVDLYATALDLAGIAVNPESQGTGLLPWSAEGAPRRPHPVFSHLPGRARAVALGRYKLIVPLRGAHELYDLEADPEERDNLTGRRPIAERALRNVFGLGVTYERSWSRQRWGRADSVSSAFASDHGL